MGSYPKGASPYGALDMAGNVWEWTSSAVQEYPYDPKDGREEPERRRRACCGAARSTTIANYVRCAVRNYDNPDDGNVYIGFRVVVSPGF